MSVIVHHQFTKSQIKECEELFSGLLVRYFGELWEPKSDAEYRGKVWDCRLAPDPESKSGALSHLQRLYIDSGLWQLVQAAKHTGANRVFGKLELRDGGYLLRFLVFFNDNDEVRIIT